MDMLELNASVYIFDKHVHVTAHAEGSDGW